MVKITFFANISMGSEGKSHPFQSISEQMKTPETQCWGGFGQNESHALSVAFGAPLAGLEPRHINLPKKSLFFGVPFMLFCCRRMSPASN